MLPLALIGCSLLPSSVPEEVCGDGAWTSLEACDPSEPVYGPWCTDQCAWQVCGDGVLGPDEACEFPSLFGPCNLECMPTGCGNGTREEGEMCLTPADTVTVGEGALDLALADADRDGDADLIVAVAEGMRLWLNDGGRFERTALILGIDRPVAVAGFEGILFALHADGLYVAFPWALDHEIVLHPYWDPNACNAPTPASLSVGRLGITRYAAWTCDEGAFSVEVDHLGDASITNAGFELVGAATTFVVTDSPPHLPHIWSGLPGEASLGSNSPTTVLPLPAPAFAIRQPYKPDPVTRQMVVLLADTAVVVGGTTITSTLPMPGVIDAAVGPGEGGLGAAYIDPTGIVAGGVRGPAVPGLARVLIADLDLDGHDDIVALRPVSGEVHVWMQRP